MGNLPHAQLSPRIVNGVIAWYQDDTFELHLTLNLRDQDGEHIDIAPTDTVKIVFSKSAGSVIKEFAFTGIVGNTVTMDFDETTTALFDTGVYTYDVYLTSDERTTLAKRNKVIVE